MITAVALAVSVLSAAVCMFTLYQLRAGWKAVRKRETIADAYEKILGNRAADLRRREKALWWAERSPQWLR